MKVLLVILALAALAAASQGGAREQLQEEFGYVEVRPGAHMFWVMYHVDQTGNYTDYPLIMWLQGGPGASGVGYGNFEELGPYDINGNLREFAWTKKANVMFVDNPVGTGYSYVDDLSLLTTDNAMIASDLVTLVKSVFTDHPDMQVMPFYVFAESYGGKMTVDFALAFDQAIKNGDVVSDFRGVALGDSWISPMDSVNTWGTFLYQMGFVNQKGLQAIDAAAADTQAAVDAGLWTDATDEWSYTELVVSVYGNNVNFYNVLATDDIYRSKESNSSHLSFMSPAVRRLYENHVAWQTRDALGDLMNGDQAEKWGIPDDVVWDSQGGMVFSALAGDFMKPVVDSVVQLLTATDLHVVVFTGDLDLICDTPGTYRWIENMEWPDKPTFMDTHNKPIYITAYSSHAGTIQASGKFSLYTILRSGHMAPIDAPEMSLEMLDMIFASTKENIPKQETPKQEEAFEKEALKLKAPAEVSLKEAAVKEEVDPKQEPVIHEVPKPVKLANLKKVEAFKEEAKKEHEATKEEEKEESQEEEKETKQEDSGEEETKRKEDKEEKKQEAHTEEDVAPKQQSKQDKKEQEKQKQEKGLKQEKIKEKVATKVKQTQEKYKQEKEAKPEKYKQEKEAKPEKYKQEKEANPGKYKQEKEAKPEKYKQEKEAKPEKYKQGKEAKPEKYKQEKETKQEKYKQKESKKEKAPKQKEAPKQETKKSVPLKEVNKAKAKVVAARQHQQQSHQRSHNPGPLSDGRRKR